MELKRGIDAAVTAIIANLKALATPTKGKEDIAQVGTISANGDTEIGKHDRRGDEEGWQGGRDHRRRGEDAQPELDVIEHAGRPRSYLSPYFVTDTERMEVNC